jgi:hypothetical protein
MVFYASCHWLICVTMRRWGIFGNVKFLAIFVGEFRKMGITPPAQNLPNEKHLRDTVSSSPIVWLEMPHVGTRYLEGPLQAIDAFVSDDSKANGLPVDTFC